jgi:HAD superfamily hydrolase (TIGR01509 family)
MRFDCVIFDMDGTLTEDRLNFAAIRAELGIAPAEGILEAMAAMDPARRAAAEARLLAHEMAAARDAPLADGALDVVQRIRRAGIALALLTRNTRAAMHTVLGRFELSFDATFAREDGPIKPSPDTIWEACRRLQTTPARTACVGDWVFDIQAAKSAGCTAILLARGRQLDFAGQADHVIQSLRELPGLLGLDGNDH